jgi:hypothetical protein
LLGGLLESSSMWFGLKFLTILAALLYIASAIFLRTSSAAAAEIQTDQEEPVLVS